MTLRLHEFRKGFRAVFRLEIHPNLLLLGCATLSSLSCQHIALRLKYLSILLFYRVLARTKKLPRLLVWDIRVRKVIKNVELFKVYRGVFLEITLCLWYMVSSMCVIYLESLEVLWIWSHLFERRVFCRFLWFLRGRNLIFLRLPC